MNEEFIYKNVFDVEVRRIDEKIENAVSRMEAKSDAYMARVDGAIAEMRGDIKAIRAEVSTMGWTITLAVALMGVILTGVSIYFSMSH